MKVNCDRLYKRLVNLGHLKVSEGAFKTGNLYALYMYYKRHESRPEMTAMLNRVRQKLLAQD